jgi:hypothetical protein
MNTMRVDKPRSPSKSPHPTEESSLHPRVRQFIEAIADLCVERDLQKAASGNIGKRREPMEISQDPMNRRLGPS